MNTKPTQDAASTPIVDQAALVRLQGLGGDRLVAQMVHLYLQNAAERLAQIDGGLAEEGSISEAESGAHSLKSSAANVGAVRVNALCATMESSAARGDRGHVRELRGALGDAVEDSRTRLNQLVEELET